MTPKLRRLYADYNKMEELKKSTDLIDYQTEGGMPPQKYIVTYKCGGVKWNRALNRPEISYFHKVEFYLHADYPRTRPIIQFLTEIFHPNVDERGWVCLGGWAPEESLKDLCIRIGEMIQYKNYDIENNVNHEAANWARRNKFKFPVDTQSLAVHKPEYGIKL
jgi:ubiquitin-protein ligase